ncbi:MAG: Spy/CpxP family protein refolding chaperone [candidate division Zixibacteria bacterium]
MMFKSILTVFASILVLSAVASAQPRGGMMMAADELELTDQQIERLEDLRYQHQKEMIGRQAAVKEAKLELRELMRKTDVSEKGALAKQERVLKAKAEVARAKLKHKLAARKLLTEEQFEKWKKMKRGKGHRRGSGMKGGCDGPGPGMGGHPGMRGGHGKGMEQGHGKGHSE